MINSIVRELKNHPLKKLSLEARCTTVGVDLLDDLAYLYNLQEFSFINFTIEGNHDLLLAKIKFPRLKSLNWIASKNQQYSDISNPIINLIQNHAMNLEHLNIEVKDIKEDTLKAISQSCSNLKSFSYVITDPNNMKVIYYILKNNLRLTSIDLCIVFSIRNSFLLEFAQNIPKYINNIAIGYSIFGKEHISIFLQNLNCKLKSFRFNWQNQKNVNLYEVVRNISKEKDWIFKGYEPGLLQYQDTYTLKWM